MRKIRLLIVAFVAMLWVTNLFAVSLKSNYSFLNEPFTGTSGTSCKSTYNITGAQQALFQTPINNATVSDVTGTVLGLTYQAVGATAQIEASKSSTYTWNLPFYSSGSTVSYSGYLYMKTAAYFPTISSGTAITYSLKNSAGEVVFQFSGSNTKNAGTTGNIFTTGVPTTTSKVGLRGGWADIEFIIDIANKKLLYLYEASTANTTKTYTMPVASPIDLTANGISYSTLNLASIDITTNTTSYSLGGFDNTTIGQISPDNIRTISGATSLQSVDGSTQSTNINVQGYTVPFTGVDLPFSTSTDIPVTWSISDWGGMSAENQAKVSISSSGNNLQATLSVNGATSADATITVSAAGPTTLTKTITINGASIAGVKAILNTEMSNATTLRDNITASNPYITGIKGTLTAAISTANDVYTNSASALEVSTATTTLHTAETAFTDAMTPYNTYVTYIGTVTSGRDAEARTAPFFTAIKAPLTSAISTATDAELTVTSTTDISDAKTALQTAYTQFTTDKPAYDNLNTQISTVTSRLAIANARKGDSRFLMFPTATVQTLTDANTTATTALGSETTVSGLSTAQSTLTTALNAFNTAARVGTGTSYYRIYTNGADNGDGTTTKSILFAEGTTLKYTPSSSALNANSIWEITEGTTIGTYTIKNVGTGNYFYCPSTTTISLNSTSTLFTLPEGYSQTNLIKYGSDTYFVYYIVNPSNKGLEVDSFNTVLTGVNKGKFLINSAAANRFRFCYQFEPVKTWKGVSGNWSETANWSDAIAPTTEDVVVGTGSVTLDQDATPANLMIATGAQVTVNAGKKLTTTSTFANNGTINLLSNETDGTATTLSGAGTATVQQYLTSGRNWYVSSPVAAATTSALSSASSINYYDEPSAAFVAFSIESPLSPLKGYISAGTVTSGAVTFSGTLNDGVQTVTLPRTSGVTKSGFNLVGNPYPSYLNWDLVQQTNMDPTMWYRTMNAGATAYVFDTYNSTSQLGTGNNGETVNSNIPPMQAFWVRVKAALDGSTTSGTLTFNNSMRTHKGSQTANSVTTPDVKLKSRAVANVTQQVLRLQVSNGTNSDEAIVYFNPNASDGLDDYDSPKMSNANAAIPEIYTIAGTEKLVINGLSVVTPEETLPLGFTTGQSNSFSIKATQIANFDGMKVYLRDNVLNTEQELTDASSYTFTSDIATTTTRFSVVFKSAGVTTGINASTNQTVVINKNANNQITVNCNGAINSDSFVSVYNALGQKVSAQQITASNTIISSSFKPGVYVVTVNNGNKTTTKKVILN